MPSAGQTAAEIHAALMAHLADVRNSTISEIEANLVEASPVDTGHFRAGWVASLGAPATAEVAGADGSAAAAGLIEVMASTDPTVSGYITNAAPYTQRLLDGWSTQAAPGWDLIAIDKAVETVRQRFGDATIEVSGRKVGVT